MDRVEGLVEAFAELGELLYSDELDPDPERRDWSSSSESVDELIERYETALGALDECADELEEDVFEALELRACRLGLGVFAVLRAAGRSSQSLPLLGDLIDRSRDTDEADLFTAVDRDQAGGAELARLRYRVVRGDRTARAPLKRLAKTAGEPAIAARARELAHAPQPVDKAPPMVSLNGFGTGLYGTRDIDPGNDSRIKTLCITLLWVPVFPISAYRVINHGAAGFLFLSKNRLSTFARVYQKVAGLAVVALIAYAAVNAYLGSASRLAKKALAAADAASEAGDTRAALEGYERVVRRYAGRVDRELIGRAATRATSIRLDGVERPVTAENLPRALEAIRAVGAYPVSARAAAAGLLGPAVLEWSDELASASALDAAARLLDAAKGALPPDRQARVDQRAQDVKTELAAALAPRRPHDALATLVSLGARDKARELIAAMLDHPSLLREAAPLVETWLSKSPDDTVSARLAEAVALDSEPTRAAALAGDDRAAIEAALVKHPGDHELTAALADLDRAAGQPREAIKRLEALGDPGWLVGSAQVTLAMAHVEAGELEVADRILDELLRYRLGAFREASSAYRFAAETLREGLIRRVNAESAPPHVMAAVKGTDESHAAATFEAWVASEIGKDARLSRLRDEYQRHGIVVSASVALGTIKLQRANQVEGEAREALLAGAERTFLAISDDAVGMPSYHLGLGQVYHRLGKRAEGDAELDGLLRQGDPELSLAVSNAYRELGNYGRSKEIAEKVFNTAPSPLREAAAVRVSLLVDTLDEKETWLERADASQPEVRAQLDQIRAERAARDGDDRKAAELFRAAARHYEKSAAHSSAAANNAALAYRGVYSTTGDRKELARARAGLEAALRLEPANPLVLANLSEHLCFEGWLQVLASELPVAALRLDSGEIASVVDQLETTSPVLERAATNPLLRRCAELTSQRIVLAPSAADGWSQAIRWASLRGAVAELESLARRLERASIDTSATAARSARWKAGELDELMREQIGATLARQTKLLAAAKATGSKRAVATAHLLLSQSLAQSGWIANDREPLERAYQHAVAAGEGWPELGDTSTDIALTLAVVRAGTTDEAIRSMRERGFREWATLAMVIDALLGDDATAVRAALARDPAIAERARRLAGDTDLEPGLSHWVIGTIAGDPALAARGASRMRERRRALVAQLGRALDPDSKGVALFARIAAKPELLEQTGR